MASYLHFESKKKTGIFQFKLRQSVKFKKCLLIIALVSNMKVPNTFQINHTGIKVLRYLREGRAL
jgi:hypothetical protein